MQGMFIMASDDVKLLILSTCLTIIQHTGSANSR